MTAEGDAQPSRRRRPKGLAGFEEKWKTEEADKASRIDRAILKARLKRLGELPLEAIEDAVGKELERRRLPPRLGRFFVEFRISELPGGDVDLVTGAWRPAGALEDTPPHHVEVRHPTLAQPRPGVAALAELLVLVDEVRAAIAAGSAAAAAATTWRLHHALSSFGSEQGTEDKERGRVIREAARKGRHSPERMNGQRADKHNLWMDLNAELRRSRPQLRATARAKKIEEETGDKWDTIRRYLRDHDPDERQQEKWEARGALPKNIR